MKLVYNNDIISMTSVLHESFVLRYEEYDCYLSYRAIQRNMLDFIFITLKSYLSSVTCDLATCIFILKLRLLPTPLLCLL